MTSVSVLAPEAKVKIGGSSVTSPMAGMITPPRWGKLI